MEASSSVWEGRRACVDVSGAKERSASSSCHTLRQDEMLTDVENVGTRLQERFENFDRAIRRNGRHWSLVWTTGSADTK